MKLLQSLFGFFIQWYDNGIYYPDIFLIVMFLVVLTLSTSMVLLFAAFFPRIIHIIGNAFVARTRIMHKKWDSFIRSYRRKDKSRISVVKVLGTLFFKKLNRKFISAIKLLQKDPLTVFIVLLLIMLLTRFSVSYFDSTRNVVAPEKIFQLGIAESIGRDLYVGIYEPASALIGGKGFYTPTAATGPALLSIAGPFIHAAFKQGFCSFTTLGCFYYFYKTFLIVSFFGWVLFGLFIAHGHPKEIQHSLLVYFLIFFFKCSREHWVGKREYRRIIIGTRGFCAFLVGLHIEETYLAVASSFVKYRNRLYWRIYRQYKTILDSRSPRLYSFFSVSPHNISYE